MIRFALRSLAGRRRRTALTLVAVVLGVAMIAGTFVFTDTINTAYRQLFTDATRGADVVVTGRADATSRLSAPATIPVALVKRIVALPGAAAVRAQIVDSATFVGRDGGAIRPKGADTLAYSYLPAPFGAMRFVSGTRPRGPNQVAIDEDTAASQHLRVGDVVRIVTAQPARRFRIAAVARIGAARPGGATFAIFSLPTAQALFDKQGRVDRIYVAAAGGTTVNALLAQIRPLLGPELEVRTAAAEVDHDVRRAGGNLALLKDGLLAFAIVAVLVGAFLIFNTFSITVAQRSRELALLRAIGARRGQVLASVLAESVAIGLLAAVIGVGAGIGTAAVMRALAVALGFDLPSAPIQLTARTVVISLAVGTVVTAAAALLPAIRATAVAPLEALRGSAASEVGPPDGSPLVSLLVIVLVITGLALIIASGGSTANRAVTSGAGAALLLAAVVLLTPRMVETAARAIAWPIERRSHEIVPRLARENVTRSPGRTAVTAASLMIGLGLVLFVTVYASGLRASSDRAVNHTIVGDLTIENTDAVSPIPAASARAAVLAPGVEAISSLKTANARIGGTRVRANGIDPTTLQTAYRFDWVDGGSSVLDNIGLTDAVVERDTAASAHLHIGDRVTMTTENGVRTTVTVRGVYRDPALLPGITLTRPAFDAVFRQPRLQAVFVKLAPGADPNVAAAALSQSLASLPGVTARSAPQLKAVIGGRVDSVLVLFYALLAMSVLISVLGLVNALSLSVHERTRELGLLRAVGMTPGQARRLVRIESTITAAMGAITGIVLGLVLSWVMTRALAGEGFTFSLPWLQVVALVALGLLAGVLAALPPAASAARLDVLAAIAHE